MTQFMIRRRFLIPKGESVRDYSRKDITPSDFIFDCDYEVDEDGK
jgi:hypothetical protein